MASPPAITALLDAWSRGNAITHGDSVPCVPIDHALATTAPGGISVLASDDALSRLTAADRGLAHIVELHAFADLTNGMPHACSTSPRRWRSANGERPPALSAKASEMNRRWVR